MVSDSAAKDHVTSSLNHLSFPKPYNGQDHLIVGNGQNLPITHVGNSTIPSSSSALHLKNVFRVPSIASNLASVHKNCHDNNYWCYFDENMLFIQALAIGNVLYQGKSEGGVYSIYPHKASKLSLAPKLCNSVALASIFNKTLWHMRLGHPNDQVLHILFPKFKSISNKCKISDYSYTNCLYGKMLPFQKSHFTASSPFELVHSNLWGPAPITSVNGFNYYVLFVDHFTRFTWIYLLQSKSEVFDKFVGMATGRVRVGFFHTRTQPAGLP